MKRRPKIIIIKFRGYLLNTSRCWLSELAKVIRWQIILEVCLVWFYAAQVTDFTINDDGRGKGAMVDDSLAISVGAVATAYCTIFCGFLRGFGGIGLRLQIYKS